MQDEYRFAITSLPEYLAAQPTDGLPTWCGRAAVRRTCQRADGRRVEPRRRPPGSRPPPSAALERRAEPLSALLPASDAYPHALLGVGWRNLVLNSAHDSSCACSHDDVVEAVRVRYQEARHIGDALARDALAALADDDRRSAGVDRGREHRGRRSRAASSTMRAPGDGAGAPRRGRRRHGVPHAGRARPHAGEGFSTVVTGQKIRWVLEMMRGPEFAGARIARVEQRRRDDGVVEFTFHDAAPGEPAIDLESTREAAARARRGGRDDRDPAAYARRCRTSCSRRARCRASAGARSASPRARGRRTVRLGRAGPSLANEHLRVEVDPGDGTLTIDGRRRARHRRQPLRRRRRRRRHLQLQPARRPTRSSTTPSRCTITVEERARSARVPSVTADVPVAHARDRRRAVVLPAQRRHRRSSSSAPCSSCAPASASCASASSSTTACATTDSARTSRFPRPSTAPTPSARSRSCTAVSPPKAARTSAASPRSCRAASSTAPTAKSGSRCSTTVCSSTRSSATEPSSRSRSSARPATCRARSSRSARIRPGRSIRSRARSSSAALALEYAVLPHRGDWRAARPRTTRPTSSSCRSSARAAAACPERDRSATGQRALGRRRAGIGRAARSRRRACWSSGSSTRRPSGDRARSPRTALPARGEVVDLVGTRRRATFAASVALRPWEIVTLRLD